MIEQLPLRGAYYRASLGHAWADAEHLLADVVDTVRENTWAVIAAQPRDKGKQAPRRPKAIKRPGQPEEDRIGDRGERSVTDVITYLDSLSSANGKGVVRP